MSRAMDILEGVIAHEPAGLRLADLSLMIDAPKSSLHGLARGLVAKGYLRERAGRYFAGPALGLLARPHEVPAVFHHALERLSGRWGETALLATVAGDSVINLDAVEPDRLIRASPLLNQRREIWPGSYGQVFLAFMEPSRRNAILTRRLPDDEARAAAQQQLAAVRRSGVAFNRGSVSPDLFGVAAPLRVPGVEVRFAIGLAGPAIRMAPQMERMAEDVLHAARDLLGPGR